MVAKTALLPANNTTFKIELKSLKGEQDALVMEAPTAAIAARLAQEDLEEGNISDMWFVSDISIVDKSELEKKVPPSLLEKAVKALLGENDLPGKAIDIEPVLVSKSAKKKAKARAVYGKIDMGQLFVVSNVGIEVENDRIPYC